MNNKEHNMSCTRRNFLAGIVRLPVPVSGYAEVTWTEDVPQFKLSHDGQRACNGE